MYAVIDIGGKQYSVKQGDKLDIELLDAIKDVTFDRIVMISDNGKVELGNPFIAKAKVKAKVLEHGKYDKVLVFKYKNKTNYRNKNGHRQQYTTVEIEEIKIGS